MTNVYLILSLVRLDWFIPIWKKLLTTEHFFFKFNLSSHWTKFDNLQYLKVILQKVISIKWHNVVLLMSWQEDLIRIPHLSSVVWLSTVIFEVLHRFESALLRIPHWLSLSGPTIASNEELFILCLLMSVKGYGDTIICYWKIKLP